jgi:hypothetical protein
MELMGLDVGSMYTELCNSKIAGFIPLMAGCSIGQIGALNAESFYERILSCANDVVQTDNTLLDDVEVEMLVLLRMNFAFMEFMRANYADVVREQFGFTVIL